MDHSEFDKEMVGKLGETQDFAFDENQWERLEAELDKKKEKRRPIAWWFWGSAASIILLLGFGYYSYLLNQKIDVLEKKVAQFSKVEEQKITNTSTLADSEENVSLNKGEIINDKHIENKIKQNIEQNKKPDTKQIANGNRVESSVAIIKSDYGINILNIDQRKEEAEDIKIVDKINSSEPLIIRDENIASQITNDEIDNSIALVVENWKAITELENKEEILAAVDYPKFTPSKLAMSNPFRFKNIAIGTFGQTGWNIGSSNTFLFTSANDPASFALDDQSNLSLMDNSSKYTDVQVWQYGVRSKIQFTHGLGINISLSKKIFDIAYNAEGFSNQISAPLLDEFLQSEFDVISSKTISQKQWVLGAGISYSPFWKWKVRPYVQITPEFSWSVKLDENYQIEDRSGTINPQIAPSTFVKFYERSNAISSGKFKLRNISTELGIEGMIGKHLQWQAAMGINTGLKSSSPNLLNRFQVGAGLNYFF